MSVYRRGSVYYYDFILEGKRYAGSTKLRDHVKALIYEEQLKEKLQQELEDARLGRKRRERYTLKQACERMYDEVWFENDTGEKSVKMVNVIIEIIGNLYIDQIASDDCRTLLKVLRRGGHKPKESDRVMPPLSNSRINRYFAALRAILRRAWKEWEVLDGVPPIPKLKEPPGRDVQYTREEEATIMKALEPYPDERDAIQVLLYTGCRLNEVVNMEFSYVQWPRDGDDENEYGAIFFPGRARKNEKPVGLPMLPQVAEVLKRRRRQLPGSRRVFPKLSGDRIDKLWARVVRPALQTDNPDYVVHGLRHTLASRLIAAGVDIYTVQQILGHSSIITTQRYLHRNPQRLAKAMSVLDPSKTEE